MRAEGTTLFIPPGRGDEWSPSRGSPRFTLGEGRVLRIRGRGVRWGQGSGKISQARAPRVGPPTACLGNAAWFLLGTSSETRPRQRGVLGVLFQPSPLRTSALNHSPLSLAPRKIDPVDPGSGPVPAERKVTRNSNLWEGAVTGVDVTSTAGRV